MAEWTSLLNDAKRQASEQFEAAWQLHVDRVAEALESGWRENIQRVVDQRFDRLSEELTTANTAYLETEVETQLKQRLDSELEPLVEQRAQERLEAMLEERVAARLGEVLEPAVEERLQQVLAERLAEQLEPEVERRLAEALPQRVEEELAKQLPEKLEAELAPRVQAEVENRLEWEVAFRLAQVMPERVEASVQERLTQLLPERVQEAVAARLSEEVPAAVDAERARLEGEFNPRLEEAKEQIREEVRTETVAKTRDSARRELGLQLSQALRVFRRAHDANEWKEAVLDAVQSFTALSALFLVTKDRFALEGVRGMVGELETSFELEFEEAAAFQNCLQSRDVVVAVRGDSEVSPYVMSLRPDAAPSKCFIFPVTIEDTVAAILYVEPGEQPLEVGAVETLVTAAGLSLGAIRAARAVSSSSLVNIAAAISGDGTEHSVLEPVPVGATVVPNGNGTHAAAAATVAVPERSFSWDALSTEERELHMRAQRFARVQVAEMRLYKDDAVKSGRRDANIYLRLRSEIDEARERYQAQFLDGQETHMRDYLHAELVETLAIDNPQLMGPDYPGALS